MPNRKTKPTSPGRRFATYPLREQLTAVRAGAQADRGPAQVRRPQRQRPRHRPPPRRRRQAPLPADRLQAPQGRRAGQGRDDRVRPEPQLLHRPAALRRRREELHPRPGRDLGRRPGPVRPGRRHHGPATRWRCARCRPARSSTTSSSSPARAASSAAPPGPRSSSPRRRATWSPCACPPRRCAWSAPIAARPSASSPTPSTRTSRSARPAATATRASARRRAASR